MAWSPSGIGSGARADPPPPPAGLSRPERLAIAALIRLAHRWPSTLALISMDGILYVTRTGDPRFGAQDSTTRQEAIITDIPGIPNDGGAW